MMTRLRQYVSIVTHEALRTAWLTIGILGVISGVTVVSVAADLARADAKTLLTNTLVVLVIFTVVGGYRAWKAEQKSTEELDNEVDDLQLRLQNAAPTLIGGAGGDGGSEGVGDIVVNGNAGGGGSVAYGEGVVAYGGQGGQPPVSVFEMLARASLGMGYDLEESINYAGFDPHGLELDRVGAGGDGSSDRSVRPTDGGPSLILISGLREPEPDGYRYKFVSVIKSDGERRTWSRRVLDGKLEPPKVELVLPGATPVGEQLGNP